MTIADVSLSMNLRLNKGDSQDYDMLWRYHKANAFNKAVLEWVRRQKLGKNQLQQGDEETDTRVDDLQPLLTAPVNLTLRDKGLYVESGKLPADYLYHKRVSPTVSKGSCENVRIRSRLREEANADELINLVPSFEFEETFHTIRGNKIIIYHNKQFSIDKAEIVYYRKPKVYDFSKLDDLIEFKDDVCEILIDEACKILATDIESFNQKGGAQERAENNT